LTAALPFKQLRTAYGFDEVAIAPGALTINPEMTSTELSIGDHLLKIPIMASAMDAVVSPATAVLMCEVGGLGVLNLEGLYTRYRDPALVLEEIISASQAEVTTVLQRVYAEPVKDELVGQRVKEIKNAGAICAVSVTPQNAKRLSSLAVEAGTDILLVQSTVTTARHVSYSSTGLVLSKLKQQVKVPIVVGNCVGYNVAMELMETGIDGVLVGVGPGAACTTREVVGVGVPQVTATLECAAAREEYLRRTGRYIAIITDGGIRTGGDLCKAIVSGADGVMLGTPFAQSEEAPGRGFNWGMANPHPDLPRGTRIKVGTKGSVRKVLFGPTSVTDGTENLVGALRVCMGMCGAETLRDLQKAELIIAPAIKTEGKIFQFSSSSAGT
jgi:IMP dehydrogenase